MASRRALEPALRRGVKDSEACRIFYEPLAGWDSDGNLLPQLAAEIPSRQNGGLGADGKSVTWKLKRGVTWHDGKPFTADDVVFTAAYAGDPAAAMVTVARYKDIVVEKIDSHTVKVSYPKAVPFWAEALVGGENPANTRPVGTGPYKIVDFKPGDGLRAVAYASYHVPNQPHFDALEIKGGSDATSAARAVLQTAMALLIDRLGIQEVVFGRSAVATANYLNNPPRFRSPNNPFEFNIPKADYDATFKASQTELDPVKRAALFIKMNDLLAGDGHVIALSYRPRSHGVANKLVPALSAWDGTTWALGYWYREG